MKIVPCAVTRPVLRVEDWGLTDYQVACERQMQMVQALLCGQGEDALVLTEHPPTVTLGRRGGLKDLRCPEESFAENGVLLQRINRGGLATAHEPGQLVVYPVLTLQTKDLHLFIAHFLAAVVALLDDYGLQGQLKQGAPGVWVANRKICSFGVALKKWVTSHGIALNINNSLQAFELIIPCGEPTETVTSLSRELQRDIDIDTVKQQFIGHFCRNFGYEPFLAA